MISIYSWAPWVNILKKKVDVTLITGGAGGFGGAIAKRLLSDGHTVIINYPSSGSKAIRLKDELGKACHIVRADVSSREEVNGMAGFIEERFGRLDNLINNAGITKDGLMIRYTEKDWDDVMNINLKGCFYCVRAMSPLIKDSGGGHIINISSYSGVKGKEGQSAYSASKAGMIGFGRSLAAELAPHNIRVNTVLPGYMGTKMGASSPWALEKARDEGLLHRLSDPDEAAGFVAYLCTTRNITGQLFSLDNRII